MRKTIVAIVGRPNVGKSTLFNRVARTRAAIVEGEPGVTRDRLYMDCSWLNYHFTLVDTGGIQFGEDDPISVQTKKQAEVAIEEADVILFMVDGRQGLTPADEEIAEELRKTAKPVLVVVNKIDTTKAEDGVYEFYGLGIGEPIPISAEHGRGIGDLLDATVKQFPEVPPEDYSEDVIKVAVIGRPNVGKSSLVNRILGQERVIVSDIPGTTRDAIDSYYEWKDRPHVLIDTAGIRRKRRIDQAVERYSVIRALKAVDRSDVCLMMIDATTGVVDQDKRIAGYAHEEGRGVILVVNKWDLVEKDSNTIREFEADIRNELGFLQYAPLIFISAKTGKRVPQLLDLVDYVAAQHALRISTGRINEVIQEAIAYRQPPSDKGERLKIYYAHQARVKPPLFVLHVNNPELMHFSYQRYLENRLREAYGFHGTPIRFAVRKSKGKGVN